eukprot:gene34689-42786_t
MVGDGGARWLAPVLGAPLRAVPHALIADLKKGSGATRSWYGKMFLPPSDALMSQDGLTFQQYQTAQSNALARKGTQSVDAAEESPLAPVACGGAGSAYGLLSSSTQCTADDGSDGIVCWMTCMSVSNLDCGTNAECVDPATDQIVDGNTAMCATCIPECVSSETNSTAFTGYCYGTGVSMYMQGFTSIIAEDKSTTACLNLLFTEWTLDSSVNVEMFCMVCLGLSIGFAMFNLKTPPSESTDPCCPPDTEDVKNESKNGLLTKLNETQNCCGEDA